MIASEALAYYQPIVDSGGRACSLEALAPDPAILADLSAAQLRAWDLTILEQATQQVAEWQGQSPGLGVSINISPLHLEHTGFADEVAQRLRGSRLHPGLITLEILESPALRVDHPAVQANLAALCRLGLKFALDDVGTGSVSTPAQAGALLTLLDSAECHFHELKLARELVQLGGGAGHRLADRYIKLAQQYDLRVVAEGIETKEQFDRVHQLGCNRFQGWRYTPKLPAPQIYSWLLRHPSASVA